MLEHHGFYRCLDKGLHGFNRCIGLSVLAYNLHILGNILQAADDKKEVQSKQRKQRYSLISKSYNEITPPEGVVCITVS